MTYVLLSGLVSESTSPIARAAMQSTESRLFFSAQRVNVRFERVAHRADSGLPVSEGPEHSCSFRLRSRFRLDRGTSRISCETSHCSPRCLDRGQPAQSKQQKT